MEGLATHDILSRKKISLTDQAPSLEVHSEEQARLWRRKISQLISEVEEVLDVEEIVVEEEVEEIVAEEENDFNEIIILLYISQMRIRKSKDRIFRYETHSLCFRKDLTSKFCPCLIC